MGRMVASKYSAEAGVVCDCGKNRNGVRVDSDPIAVFAIARGAPAAASASGIDSKTMAAKDFTRGIMPQHGDKTLGRGAGRRVHSSAKTGPSRQARRQNAGGADPNRTA